MKVVITLPGFKQFERIECLFDRLELRALGRRELHAHGVQFLDPDAVLAGDGTPSRTLFPRYRRQTARSGASVRLVRVEQDQRCRLPSPA